MQYIYEQPLGLMRLDSLGHAEGSRWCYGSDEGGLDGARDGFIAGEVTLGIAKN